MSEEIVDGAEVIKQGVENINKQIEENIKENPPDESFLTEEETFNVLEGGAIEYETSGGLFVKVERLRIKQKRIYLELMQYIADLENIKDDIKTLEDSNKKVFEIYDNIAKCLAPYLKIEKDVLEDNCDEEDYLKIIGLMATSVTLGKDLLSKKKVSVSLKRQ